nr:hypothetical protein [Candidatus Cloacimonadota bacterium]
MFQLSFLNAGLLIFAAATLLPLIIWLLAKKKPPQIVFSSIRFLKISSEEKKKRTRLTNILLLIIRMLIILLIALAVSRPMLRSSIFGNSDKHPPSAIAIVIDTSYSMDYTEDRKSRMDLALNAIKTINQKANPSDRLILISRDQNFNNLYAQIYAGQIPEELLTSLNFSWQALSWEETFALAHARLRDAQMPNNEIYLLSDFVNEEIRVDSEYPILAIPIFEKDHRQNISISEAQPLPQIVDRNQQQTIEYRITNHGNEDRAEVLVQAVLGDIKVAESFVSIPARQSVKKSISFNIRRDGWQSGYIEVLDGYLGADNRSYFAFEYHQYPQVAVITTSVLPKHLDSILRLYSGGKEPVIIPPAAANMQSLADYRLVIFYEPGELSPRLRDLIRRLDSEEIGSLFCLGKNLTEDYKSFLNNRFEQNISGYKAEPVSIDYISKQHHASSLIADKELRLNRIDAYWESPTKGNTLIAAASNAMVVQKEMTGLWLWDISSHSDFFSDPAYAVFAYRMLNTLQSGKVPIHELSVGDPIYTSDLLLPSNERLSLAKPIYITQEPGIYTLRPDDTDPTKIAVNIDYYDSEIERSKIPNDIKILSEDYANKIFVSRLGRDLWKLLLCLALLLMILEIIIVKYEQYKSSPRRTS